MYTYLRTEGVHSIYLACLFVGCVVVMFFNRSAHSVMFPDISTIYRWTVDMRQCTNYQHVYLSKSAQILFSHMVLYCTYSRVYVVFTYLHIFGTTTRAELRWG
jgi:cytochrome bd-type quinol oxidase subunit 1